MTSMSSQRLRVGVIGAGVGALHLAAYTQIPQVEIAALAGLDDDRVRRVAAEYHVPRTYREYEQLLAAPDIDAVSVCLPNILHMPVSIAALRAGKHVLVAKPRRGPRAGGGGARTRADFDGELR